ncbi:MAG: DNA alkylation repair protein [Bacteroides sp.]|nr:DNA alkylation repair protein [Bacteroides sp.]
MIQEWQKDLRQYASEDKAKILSRFFKTGKGEYGEGDQFLGITVPAIRAVSRNHSEESVEAIGMMLQSPWHEDRMSALLTLVEQYRRKKSNRKEITDFYVANLSRANNWDLIDLSAPKILGEYVAESGETDRLLHLSDHPDLWHQRAAIVATLTLIKKGEFSPTILLAEKFLAHPHPLMHKATGWMLREMGKRSEPRLTAFLDLHTSEMPRTALRYAIERLSAEQRAHYMHLPHRRLKR